MGDGEARCRRLDEENAFLRAEGDGTQVEFERVQKEFGNCSMTAATLQRENGVLVGKVGRLTAALQIYSDRDIREKALRARYPFFRAHFDFLMEKSVGPERAFVFPEKSKIRDCDVDWHGYYVMLSQIGEHQWEYFCACFGPPSCRTVQRWRDDKFEQFQQGPRVFDGEEANRSRCVSWL